MKKILLSIFILGMLVFGMGIASAYTPASTNDQNRINGWAHVDEVNVSPGEVTLDLIQPRNFYSCFEYRTDGDTSQVINEEHFLETYNVVDESEGLQQYPYFCLSTISTQTETFSANEYVEIRMIQGAEGDERFDWTRFDVEPVCELTIDEPFESILGYVDNDGIAYFDSEVVPIKWNLTESCTPIDVFYLMYSTGSCDLDTGDWEYIPGTEGGLTQQEVQDAPYEYSYLWDRPQESGEYCVKIKVTSNGARDVYDHFNVDLAKPEISLNVQSPSLGDCDDDEEGTSDECYVTQDTQVKLSCSDAVPSAPWQSGYDYKEYRYRVYDEDTQVWEDWTSWVKDHSFYFPEDSRHELEYRCYDNVGKVDEKSKIFIVDTQAPIFTDKSVGEPKQSGCDETINGESCDWYLTQDTEICLAAEDPQPHPVGGVEIYCEAAWWLSDPNGEPDAMYEITLDENGCFTYGKDSYHMLHCWAVDALGNRNELNDLYEADIVDTKAPNTEIYYTEPYYENEGVQWINGVSRVVLEAEDPEPHPVGGVTTNYRYAIVDESYCYWEGSSLEDADWNEWQTYTEPFLMEESCHAIEYYSVDALGNTEEVHSEFVFVDKTAPTLHEIEVGEPSHDCDSAWELITGECEENWDWIVTMGTEIELSCEDLGPHPSGVDELCYRITYDGEVVFGEDTNNDGYTCIPEDEVTLQFNEECEHQVEFYCVDNVNKTSETSTTMFKVEGEEFTIHLLKKWNLISIPFTLISEDIGEVLDQVSEDVEIVWTYEDGQWLFYDPSDPTAGNLQTMKPGHGYWVKANKETDFVIGGSLIEAGANMPPSRELEAGWNLIGHYGTTEKSAYCSLFSLVDTSIGHPRWSALFGYDAAIDEFDPLIQYSSTYPGEGYWLEMDVEDLYSPATACWGFYPI